MSKSARPVEREGTSVKAEENPDYEPEAGAGDGQAANISGCTGQKRTHTSSCTGAWTIRTSDSIQQLRGSRQLPASPRGQGNDSRSRGRFGGPGRSRALYGPFDVNGTAPWNTLTPVVGDIVTSMIPGELVEEEGVEGIWLVTGLELAADGSKMLRVKSVGSSSPSLLGVLSSLFNRKEGRLHICAGPGACHEEGAVFHVRRLEVWRGSEFPAQRLSPRGKKIIRHFARGGRGGQPSGLLPPSKKHRSLLRRRPREGKGQVTINARSSRPGQTTTPESRRLGYPGLSLFEPSWRESGRSNYARKLGRRSLEMEAPWS